ncbi:MAG TPA: NAD(P)/FAD-dependent oxidoreductase [Kofleriaceae bacterium]
MPYPTQVHAVVAGGGIAGACAAAALAQRGWRVLVVEPGVAHGKRLAGELLHPPALEDLRALGLGDALAAADAQPVEGFAVFLAGDGREQRCLLPYERYSASPSGDAARSGEAGPCGRGGGATVEHGALVSALGAQLRALPGVTIVAGRVERVAHVAGGVVVGIAAAGEHLEVRAELLVAADGRGSNTRKLAGIGAQRTHLSTMVGLLVDTDTLPCPNRGHIFVGGTGPVLAYAIAPGRVRVMLDIEDAGARDLAKAIREPARLRALPPPFRAAVAASIDRGSASPSGDAARSGKAGPIETQRPLVAANLTTIPAALVCGRVVLVGDAAGCCHPVSASGLASSAADARALGEALRTHGDIDEALAAYQRARREPHGVRIALASALYRAFAEPSPEMTLLRRGLVDYWVRSPRGRRVSMALLATQEQRYSKMAGEYARVAGYAVPALVDRRRPRLPRRKALGGLLASVVPHVRGAVGVLLPARQPPARPEPAAPVEPAPVPERIAQ